MTIKSRLAELFNADEELGLKLYNFSIPVEGVIIALGLGTIVLFDINTGADVPVDIDDIEFIYN